MGKIKKNSGKSGIFKKLHNISYSPNQFCFSIVIKLKY